MKYCRILALAVLSFALSGALHAQRIEGRVTDARTGLALADANIVLSPGTTGTTTDQSGAFVIRSVQPGVYTLKASFLGYESFTTEIRVASTTVRLDIHLTAVAMPGPTIEVSAMRARVRETPATFSDIRLGELRDRYNVQDVPVLLSDLPSSTYYSENGNGIGYNYLRIRGFDQRRLAVMINGVPQNDPEDHNVYWLDFSDLLGSTDEVQVQRGAGSAFYGPPAIGGSINIVTGDFASQKGIRLSSGYGSYNTRRSALAIGSGLLDNTYTLFARISKLQSDGYRERSDVDMNAYYFAATRYDAAVTTRINVYGGPIADGLAYYGLPRFAIGDRGARRKNYSYWEVNESGTAYTDTTERRAQEREEFSQPHAELLNEWKVSDHVTLNSSLFYFTGAGYFDYDGSWGDATYFRMTPGYGFPADVSPGNALIRAYVDNRQLGWLPRVTIDHADGTLTAGLELRRHRSLHWGRIQWAENLPAGLDPDRHYYEYHGGKDMGSAYVQEMFRISPRMTFMGSLMYAFNRYRLYDEKYVGTDFHVDYHFINPRIGVNWNVDNAWNVYGNLSYTQREPRLVNLYDAAESGGGATPQFALAADSTYDFKNPLVKPEKLFNVELGTGWDTQDLNVLVNGYLMNFTDEIVKSGGLDRFGQPITGNAERTLHLGLEASAQYTPIPSLRFSFNGMVSRSRLTRYIVFNAASLPDTLDGNRIAGFPELLANAGVTWMWHGLSASLSAKFVGDQYTDNTQNQDRRVAPYTVLNGTVGYRTPPVLGFRAIEMRLAVNNVFDRLYAQSGEGSQFFVAAERNFFFDINVEL